MSDNYPINKNKTNDISSDIDNCFENLDTQLRERSLGSLKSLSSMNSCGQPLYGLCVVVAFQLRKFINMYSNMSKLKTESDFGEIFIQ